VKRRAIGGVIAADNAVIPAAVGVDIGCGMIAVETDVPAERFAGMSFRRAFHKKLKTRIPVGEGVSHKTTHFVGRTVDPKDMLAIHYVTIGVANPVAFAALRMQTVAIKFPPEYLGDRRLLAYAVVAGLLLGIVPLAFSTPLVGGWYFGTYQNVPPRIIGTACLAVGIYSLIPVVQAIRARVEGLAALAKRPKAIMAGQIAYTASLFMVCSILLPLGTPGWAMAVTAIFIAPVCVTATIYAVLASSKIPHSPSPEHRLDSCMSA